MSGESFGRTLKKGDIVALRGGLGAGKTAFSSGIAAGLGLDINEVCSPTFAIVNEYIGSDITMYHFDMYRIMNEDALESTGFFDYPLENSVTVIEWSENIADLLPPDCIIVTINVTGENDREIIIEGGDENASYGN